MKWNFIKKSIFPQIVVPDVLPICIDYETFNNKKIIESILEKHEEVDSTFLDYYDMIIYLLAYSDEDTIDKLKILYHDLINIDKSKIMCHIASRNSIKIISN